MRFHRAIALLLLLAWGNIPGAGRPSSAATPQAKRPIQESEIQAVILAIEDEIYALNLQTAFIDVGKIVERKHILNVYFEPEVLDDSRSWVIYRLMPDGEIYRKYEIGSSGRIYLHLKPGQFRTTQPSYPTVSMDDDELCKLKHDWIKRQFVVDMNPSKETVAAARARQRDREKHY
jgi:hypothetical protein